MGKHLRQNLDLNWQAELFKEDWNQTEKEFINEALQRLNLKVVIDQMREQIQNVE